MRRWLGHASTAAAEAADRPELWLPGALAWTVTLGWIALVVGVARPPTVAELTFIGAGIFTSGAWPWNAFAIGAAALVLLLAAFALASAAEAVILRGSRASGAQMARLFLLRVVCATPTVVVLIAMATAAFMVAPLEFNAPDAGGGPVLRTILRLAPFLVVAGITLAAGAAIHVAAGREVIAGSSVGAALRQAPSGLRRAGTGATVQAIVLPLVDGLSLGLAAIALRVLWAPIGSRIVGAGIDAAVLLLLVGFVAIWLCLVLGGGALHAWGILTWGRLLDGPTRRPRPSAERMETPSRP